MLPDSLLLLAAGRPGKCNNTFISISSQMVKWCSVANTKYIIYMQALHVIQLFFFSITVNAYTIKSSTGFQ